MIHANHRIGYYLVFALLFRTTSMLRHQLLSAFLWATTVSSQSTSTVISLFLNSPAAGVSTGATGYVAAADPTATTYVLDCVGTLCADPARTEYARVTVGPGVQEYNEDHNGTATHQTCSFTGAGAATQTATCVETMSDPLRPLLAAYDTVTYVPSPPATRESLQNILTWPGLQAVMITSGVDRLAGAATATGTATGTAAGSATASATKGSGATATATKTTTGASQIGTATGIVTGGAVSPRGVERLGYGAGALAALVVMVI